MSTAHRRTDGVGARSLGRQIAALRSFARFCERRGIASTTAFASVRPPKQPKSIPKALSVADSAALVETSGSLPEEPWIAARDAAVLTLLYGCGLRISEALAITRGDAPVGTVDSIRVVGKGGRERVVPVLPAVRRAVEAYLDLVPFPLEPERISGLSVWADGTSTQGGNFFPQVGVSYESLGDMWDLRVNSYIPLGKETQLGAFEPTGIIGFQGNFLSEITVADEFSSLNVGEVEVARRLGPDRDAWAFASPYVLANDAQDTAGFSGSPSNGPL